VRCGAIVFSMLCIAVFAPVAAADETTFSAVETLTTAAAAPTIASDQADYAPGSTVTLAGSGWQAGELVRVTVNDDLGQSWARSVDVTADAEGRIADTFTLPDWFVAAYAVVATGSSGSAATSFTDAALSAAAAPAGVTYALTVQGFTSSSCLTPVGGSNGAPSTETVTAGTLRSLSFGSADFVKLTAGAATAPSGASFASWSGPGSFSSSSAAICVAAPKGGTEFVYTATYTGGTPAGPSSQTITFAAPVGATYGDANLDPGATASSGLPVSYTTVTPGTCAIAGGLVQLLAAGTCTLTASQAGNASFNPAPTVTQSFSIAAKTVAGSFTTQTKVYDGTTAAAIVGRWLSGVVGADAVFLTGGSAAFADENVGIGKPVAGTGFAISGSAAANYVLDSTTIDSTGTITPATVEVAFTVANKVYDGTATATISGRSLSGVLAGDSVTVAGGTAAFPDASAGVDKPVSGMGFSLGGADAGNYVVSSDLAITQATIARLAVTGSFTAAGKIYDGGAAAQVLTRSLAGVLDGDAVELVGGTASFADAGAGVDKTVTLAGASLAGIDAGNYVLSPEAVTALATIARLGVEGSFTAASKSYDGTAAAEVLTRSLSGALDGDDVALTGGTASFEDANAGPNKAVRLTGGSLVGADAGNYELNGVVDASATIAKKLLTVTGPSPAPTVYGDPLPPLSPGYDGFVADDGEATLALAPTCGPTPAYGGAGTYTVRCDGGEDGNYAFAYVDGALTVLAKPLTGAFLAADKVYDGTTAAETTALQLAGLVGSDTVELQVTNAAFEDENAGPDKLVTASLALAGADAGNYDLVAETGTALAAIMKKQLTVTGPSPAPIVYGDPLPELAPLYEGFVAGEGEGVLAPAPACGLAPAYHGAGSYAVHCEGGEARNYKFAYEDGTLTVNTKPLVGSFTAADKVYDGTTDAGATPNPLDGLVGADTVELQVSDALFADRNAGPDKLVSAALTLGGADAGNYHLTATTATALASILKLGLTLTGAQATSRDYDGTTGATVDFTAAGLVAPIAGDDVTVDSSAYTALFASKEAGAGKPVTVSGVALAGSDAGNYSVEQPIGLTAEIRRLAITGSFTTPASKVYDGGTGAVVLTRTALGVVPGDAVFLSGGTAAFDTKDAAAGKTVTLTGAALAGADASNYSLAGVGTQRADVLRAPLTVTAHDKQMILNGAVPALTWSITGYVVGESFGPSSGVSGAPDCTTSTGTAPGSFEITCAAGTLSAGNYAFGFVKGALTVSYSLTTCLGSAGHAILQPIDRDGSSVFKQGSTVPAKFRVCDARGVSIATPGVVASFRLVSTSLGVDGPVDEAVASTTPDTGFRWSATDQQWIFNISTKSLAANRTYNYEIVLDDGSKIGFRFGLR
jgi:hypothetical protein